MRAPPHDVAIKQSPRLCDHARGMTRNISKIAIRLAGLAAGSLLLAACQAAQTASPEGPQAANLARATPGPMQCAIDLPTGPPPKPDPLVALGTSTAWNIGRNVGRGMIAGAGTMVAGPVGGVAAGAVATRTILSEYDMRGRWTATDGSATCGCPLTFAAEVGWMGAPEKGTVTPSRCGNPLLATADTWRLDETLTGLESELLLYAANGNRIAVLKRSGADYYSGTLSDGTPVTIWRS